MKNKEVILKVPGTICIQNTDMPVPKPDEVLIKVEHVGICGSDVHSFQYGPFIPPKDPNQKIGLGHECAGTVIEVGSAVNKFKIGDRVCIEPGIPCGDCEYCRNGHYNICPNMDFMATQPNYRGALCKYICHKESYTYHLPDSMSTKEGALVEPAAVGMHAALLANVKPNSRIAILGAGCIGLMTLQACISMGATQVVVADIIPKRLEYAKKLGCTATVNTSSASFFDYARSYFNDEGPDIIFETAGSTVTAEMALSTIVRGGKIIIVGTISDPVSVRFLPINREVTIQTAFRYANCFSSTINAIASGRINVYSMITHEFSFADSQKAFDDSINNKNDIVKGVINL